MKAEKSFADIFDQSLQSDAFWEELAILGFTSSVLERLELLGLTKKNLADMLEVSPAYVTKLIGGNNNFTLRTMVKVARKLKCELNICFRAAITSTKSDPLKSEAIEPLPVKVLNRAANDYEDLALAA